MSGNQNTLNSRKWRARNQDHTRDYMRFYQRVRRTERRLEKLREEYPHEPDPKAAAEIISELEAKLEEHKRALRNFKIEAAQERSQRMVRSALNEV